MRLAVVQITDMGVLGREALFARLERVAELPAAVRARYAICLRDPELDLRSAYALALELRAATRRLGARLLVNDRLDVAVLAEADGVHLGRKSVDVCDARGLFGQDAWISVSAHSLDELDGAVAAGASAVMLSPIFASPAKGPPLGLAAIAAARRALPAAVALIALGGIDASTCGPCLAAGADAVAAIRAELSPAAARSAPARDPW